MKKAENVLHKSVSLRYATNDFPNDKNLNLDAGILQNSREKQTGHFSEG